MAMGAEKWGSPFYNNVWDYRSLEKLGKIFYNNFNHDDHEKYDSSSEHPKIFVLKVLANSDRTDRGPYFFRVGVSRGFAVKFGIICGITFLVNLLG
jgi:hypothetical protein